MIKTTLYGLPAVSCVMLRLPEASLIIDRMLKNL